MKRFYRNFATLCVLLLSAFGCRDTGTLPPHPAQEVLELLSLEVVSQTKLDFEFSAPVRVLSRTFDPRLEIAGGRCCDPGGCGHDLQRWNGGDA